MSSFKIFAASKSSAESVDAVLQRLLSMADGFNVDTRESALDKLLEELAYLDTSKAQRNGIVEKVVAKTNILRKEIEAKLKTFAKKAKLGKAQAERRAANGEASDAIARKPILELATDGFAHCVEVAQNRITLLNSVEPTWFSMGNKKGSPAKGPGRGRNHPPGDAAYPYAC